jgi:hypothetical protein
MGLTLPCAQRLGAAGVCCWISSEYYADDLWKKKEGGIQSCVCVGQTVITQHRVRCLKIFFSISKKKAVEQVFFFDFLARVK